MKMGGGRMLGDVTARLFCRRGLKVFKDGSQGFFFLFFFHF